MKEDAAKSSIAKHKKEKSRAENVPSKLDQAKIQAQPPPTPQTQPATTAIPAVPAAVPSTGSQQVNNCQSLFRCKS